MAGDWIKMRANLVSHPRVKRIAEILASDHSYQDWSTLSGFFPVIPDGIDEEALNGSLRVTRYVTVTALLKFWCYANEHARDEFIRFLSISDIDEIAGVPSFGAALEAVSWAVFDEARGGVHLPNFNEFNNVSSDRTNAERQRRHREKQKQTVTESNAVTRNVTHNDREEKRREDISNRAFKSPTPEEVTEYATTLGFDLDGSRFVDHYEAKGWKIGKSPMKDWRAAVRTWRKSDEPKADTLGVYS